MTVALLVMGLGLLPLLLRSPVLGVAVGVGLLVVLLSALRPETAIICYVAVSPLLVGLGRGALIPGLRLNEILLLPVLVGLALGLIDRWKEAGWQKPRGFHPLDLAVVGAAFSGSVPILLWMYARGRDIALDDVLYALALWKLAVIYAVVRLFLRDARSIRRLLVAILCSALLIGGIGVLQALGVGPVIDFLDIWVPPEEGGYELTGNRAMATLGNPIAYGDLVLYASVIAASLAIHGRRSRLLWAMAALLVLATLASGQVSILLGLVTVSLLFAVVTGTGRQVATGGLALLVLGLVALQPVLSARTSAADPATGLPVSWTGEYGRLANLQRYFLPELASDYNWVFGVQTSARMPGEESWRAWVYIESGYVWTMWTGGLPLLAAVVTLIVVAVRTGRRLMRSDARISRVLGTALITVPATLAVLMVLDPHLTLRGGAELFFVLLALGAGLTSADGGRPAVGEPVAEPQVGGEAASRR
jgi:hypothetical protein